MAAKYLIKSLKWIMKLRFYGIPKCLYLVHPTGSSSETRPDPVQFNPTPIHETHFSKIQYPPWFPISIPLKFPD
jgi:hypothetical protein